MTETRIDSSPRESVKLITSLNAACAWLQSQVDQQGRVAASDQAALYYKMPASLALGGEWGAALRCLDWIAAHMLDDGRRLAIPADQEARRRMNTYDRGWLAWGAQTCGRYDIAFGVAADLLQYQDPETGGFWDTAAALSNGKGIQHAMTTGMAGLGLLATRQLDAARQAAASLIRLLEIQPDLRDGMYLAVECRAGGSAALLLERTSLDYVDRNGLKQRPARLGPAQVLLVRLFRLTGERAYLVAARQYCDLFLEAREGIYDCVEAHKFLWGLAELHRVEPDPRYHKAAARIARYLLDRQQKDGQFLGDAVADSDDQPLELRLNTTCNAVAGLAHYRHLREDSE